MSTNEQSENSSLQLKNFFYKCLARWYWFLISVIVMLVGATFYILKTPSVYTRNAKVLIKSEDKGNSTAHISELEDLGFLKSGVNINNELKTIGSNDNMVEVVRQLHLDMTYTTEGLFHDNVLYDNTLPVTVELVNFANNKSAAFDMNVNKGEVTLSDFEINGDVIAGEAVVKLNETAATPIGPLCVRPTKYFKEKEKYPKIHVQRSNINSAAHMLANKIDITLADKNTDIIALSVNDINIKRADDILNMLIAVYNGAWIKDKNKITVSTSMFINDRLQVIEQDLGNVDDDISSYKSEHLLPDVTAVSNMYLQQNSETNTRINDLENQISITRYIRNYHLANETVNNQLLPVNSGINNTHIESQIAEFNTLMLRRNSLVASSSEQSPLVTDLDAKLNALRHAIITSVDNQLAALNAQLANFQNTEQMINFQLASKPTQAKYLLSVERQQKVKEALYLFLLQKREENELSQAFTAYNTRVIEHPNGSLIPTKPRKSIIMLFALIVGLAIPVSIIFLIDYLNTTVRSRSDIEKLTIPFIGEIPLAYSLVEMKKKKGKGLKKRIRSKDKEQKNDLNDTIVVKHGSRNVVNEAFRILRTNIEFMTKNKEMTTIMITSFNAGSGKSFITMNMALSLAIKNKKVLVIDGDLRRASSSAYVNSPKMGISNYLSHQVDDIDSVIVPFEKHENLKVLPVGVIPPNPTELLEDERFGQLLETVRSQYDYVFVDCPPIDIVADAQIIEKWVDRTIFVIRAGLLEKSLIPEIDNLYKQQKLKNMSLILNGTEAADSRYGYRYGYHNYGYYGHNSYYHTEEEE